MTTTKTATTLAAEIMELNTIQELTGVDQSDARAELRAMLAQLVAVAQISDVCEDGLLEDGLFEQMSQSEVVEDYRQAFGFYQFGNAKKVFAQFFTSIMDEPVKKAKKSNKKAA